MKSKIKDLNTKIILLILAAAVLVLIAGFVFHYFIVMDFSIAEDEKDSQHHIVVLGTYENELFMKQVCNGVQNNCEDYDAVVQFYVPESLAEDLSIQSLFDYAAFVNADGIIAYIQSSNESVQNVKGIDGVDIPIVTTGQFAPNVQQISYIGTSYWELGHKFGEEIVHLLKNEGIVYILCSEYSSNPNFSNLTNSIQSNLSKYHDITYTLLDQISEDIIRESIIASNGKCLFVALTEEDTIQLAQFSTEFGFNKNKNISIIGFGSNETCQFYLSKGLLNELISLDPEKIGEAALKEIFEYIDNGYANSYMAADIKVLKAGL